MIQPVVLDSSALLAVFFKEIGAAFVLDNMRDGGSENYIHGVNACEVAYIPEPLDISGSRSQSPMRAATVMMNAIRNSCAPRYNLIRRGFSPRTAWKSSPPPGVHQIDDIKGALGSRAVILKSSHPFLSLSDCFAISLAEQLNGRILTGDKRFSEADTTAAVVLIR